MFQTWLDLNKQIIRKSIDVLSGALAGWLATQGEWGAILIPLVAVAFNGLWFYIDNRNKVSVKGLQEAGKFNAADMVDSALLMGKKN